jgi:predicted nuclease with RNAse H fold
MKFFSIASAALVAFTGFVGLVAGQDSNTVVNDIKMLTKASSDAQTMVSSITVVNVVFQAPASASSSRRPPRDADRTSRRKSRRLLLRSLRVSAP